MNPDETKPALNRIIIKTENILITGAIGALTLIPFVEILLRLIARSGFTAYDDVMHHITLWAALLAALITSRNRQHISFGFAGGKKESERTVLERFSHSASAFIGCLFGLALFFSSLSFILIGFDPGRTVAGIPISVVTIIIPAAFLGIAIRSIRLVSASGGKRILITLGGLLGGILISLPAVLTLMYMSPVAPPLWLEALLDFYYIFFDKADWLLILVLVLLTIFGLPVFIFLGGTAVLLFAGNGGVPEVIPNEAYNLLTSSALPAIPLFTFTGFILSEGKSGERLVRLFRSFLGEIPGGMAVMSVLICAFFTTFTGASGVTILALGGLLSVILINSGGYSEKFSRGLITSSGSIGLLFPPSLPIIMYAVTAQISVKDMFLGGIIPGGLLVLALSVMGILHNVRERKKHSIEQKQIMEERVPLPKALKGALGDILLPVVILAGYFGGITTLVETSAVAVVYALVMETTIYRDLRWRDVHRVIQRAMPVIGGVLIILAMAKGLSYFIVDAQVPMMLTAFLTTRISSPLVFLLLLNLVLLVTGCLMDIYSAIMVVAPLIIPLGAVYGIPPVQLGIIFLANLQLGYLTPPVGMNLFLASYAFKKPLGEVYKGVIPFFLVLLLGVLLITYVPWFSLALL